MHFQIPSVTKREKNMFPENKICAIFRFIIKNTVNTRFYPNSFYPRFIFTVDYLLDNLTFDILNINNRQFKIDLFSKKNIYIAADQKPS